jgi:transposase
VKRLRREWRREAAGVDPHKLVFVDESGADTAMTRTRGRAARGERVAGAVPHGHRRTLTMPGAIRLEGLAAAATVPSPTDSDVFRAFVGTSLVPAPREGDVVVWDNLSPHKAAGVAEAVRAAGAELMPLPPYSPDFSPIEPCWSKVKEWLRAAGPRSADAPGAAAGQAFAAVTADDARGWFESCGYVVH